MDGVICPSEIVYDLLTRYKVTTEKEGHSYRDWIWLSLNDLKSPKIILKIYERNWQSMTQKLCCSVCLEFLMKNIQAVIAALPDVLKENATVKLVVAGDGPYLSDLKEQAESLGITDSIIFTGMIPPNETALYYKAADFFISASTSETQGPIYLESIAKWYTDYCPRQSLSR